MQVNYNSQTEGNEKHIPQIQKTEQGRKIFVGEILHPMLSEHNIQRIKVILKNGEEIQINLNYHQLPIIFLPLNLEIAEIQAFCNIHGIRGNKLSN